MKHLSFTAAALSAIALAACTSNSDLTQITPPNPAEEETPVAFDTYVAKTANTRTDATPNNISSVQALAASGGFGVFAYYTGATEYNSASATPNFMYNQFVGGTDAADPTWSYSPIKYWPNEFAAGNVDTQTSPAQGTTARGRVSFFAYAPYLNGSSLSGTPLKSTNKVVQDDDDAIAGGTVKTSGDDAITAGITKMSGNAYAGDPVITYTINTSDPTNNVDLLWGTAGAASSAPTYAAAVGTVTAKATTVQNTAGNYYYVWKDCMKQKTGGALSFAFVHALAKIGNITIQADPNNGSSSISGGSLDSDTKISISEVTLSYSATPTNTFNLATGEWGTPSGDVTAVTYTIGSDLIEPDYYWNATSGSEPEEWTDTNSDNNYVKGLNDNSAHSLIDDTKSIPALIFMPRSTTITVTVTYQVRTKDENLKQGWSVVPQTIHKDITIDLGLNKNYTLNIKLGIEDINLSATYVDWEAGSNQTIDLPENVN